MSRLRHKKNAQSAGAGSGVYRLEHDKPLPFKQAEERKSGGKIHGGSCGKLSRKRGGACKREDGGNVTVVPKTVHETVVPKNPGPAKSPAPDAPPPNPKPQSPKIGAADGGQIKWLKGAIKHPGALHKELHVPAGEKIPEKKLEKAAHSSDPTLRRRANLAKTMKGFHH